jgi:hypothetical protein
MQFVAAHEDSTGDPTIVNPASGASGVAQILPSSAADPGYGITPVDPTDPTSSFEFMGQFLQAMYKKTGSWADAVEKYGTTSGNPALQSQLNTLLQNEGLDGSSGTTVASSSSPAGATVQGTGFDTGAASGTTGIPNGIGGPTASEQIPQTDLSGYLSELAIRAALIILGLVCLMGGFVILGRENVAPAISRQVGRITG